MKKSQKKLLSVLFHLAVLGCMVLTYDAGKALARKMGWIKGKEDMALEGVHIDLMAQEEKLSTEIDPALAKLVKREGDAFLFQRDIPFPPHMKVITTRVTKFDKVRVGGKTEFGEGSMVLSIREDDVMEYEMAGRSVRYTMRQKAKERVLSSAERIARLKEIEEALKNKRKPPAERDQIVDDLVGKVVQFSHDGQAWKANPTKEFKTMAWGKGLEGSVDKTLMQNGLRPRPRWFGTGAMKPGDVTKLTAETMAMVFDEVQGGSGEMRFLKMEGVHGHPCAVFEVTGSFRMAPVENGEGQVTNGEATIDKGRIWCSLLYPVVLRSDLDLIVSMETREGAKLVNQLQGPIKETFHLDWKAVTAQPKQAPPAKPPGMK